MKVKEMKNLLFSTYQWPPSCIPKDGQKLKKILQKMRKLHPDAEKEREGGDTSIRKFH